LTSLQIIAFLNFTKKKSWEKIPIKKFNFFTNKVFFVFGGQFSDINNLTKKLQPKKEIICMLQKHFFPKFSQVFGFKNEQKSCRSYA